MNKPAHRSGRGTLLTELRLLVAVALLPLLGMVVWNVHDRLRDDLDAAEAVAARLARFTATDTERFLLIAGGLLDAAARHPAVTAPGGRDCDPAFAAFAALTPVYGGYVAADPQGRVFCSGHMADIGRLPEGARALLPPEGFRDRLWVASARPEQGGWVVPVVQPLRAAGGRPAGFAEVHLRPEQFRILVASARLPEGAGAGIMDGAGHLLARTGGGPPHGAGLSLAAARAAMGDGGEGTLRAGGEDGNDYLYGFVRVAGTDWVAFSVMAAAPIYDASLLQARNGALAALAALALSIALASLFGRRLLKPAVAIARAARRAAAGDPAAVRLPQTGPAELALVARQFNRLLDALAAERRTLRDREARLSELYRLAADWYWESDPEHRFTRVEGAAYDNSPIFKDVIGKRRWELPGYAPLDEDWEAFRARLARREAFYGLVFTQETASGRPRYLRVSGEPYFDEAGAFTGYRGVAADVTLEIAQRQALLANERRYRDLFDKNHLVNLLLDPLNGRIVDASEEACALFGHSRALLAQLDLAALGLRPHGSALAPLDFLRNAQPPQAFDYRTRGGEVLALEAHAGRVEADERSLLLLTLLDVTARRRAETDLRKLARAIEQSPASIVITDKAGDIEYVNPRFVEVTGYAREEALGRNPRILQSGFTPEPVYADLWRTILAGGVWRGELCNRTKQGELYWEQAAISAVIDESGAIGSFVAVKENITELKRREAQIGELNASLERRVAERTAELERANRELDAFSYSVSHDLRAPLRAINGFMHLIEESDGAALSAEGRRHLERVRHNALRMGELIDDLLKLARVGRGELALEKVSPGGMAREVVQELREHYPNAAATVGELPEAVCDRVLVKQVFANLVGNAFKYSAKAAAPRIEVGAREESGETAYYVRDNGAGFDMQYAQRLFGVFQRLHHEKDFPGTGVGLAIVKRIVERHGGRVWAESAPGEGATFHFTLAPPA